MKDKRNRRYRSLAVFMSALILLLLPVSGCGNAKDVQNTSHEGKLKVVTTLFPYYDFLRQVAGDKIDLAMIVPAGMDSHSFEPTPADMITIQNADLLVCNGGAMEQWLSKVLYSFGDAGPARIVTMMDYVDVVEEEIVEGMEAEVHDHEEDHLRTVEDAAHAADETDDGHEIVIEYDEHIWTSPVNSMKLVKILENALSEEDPENAGYYSEHADSYIRRLSQLDQEIREVVKNGQKNLLVFGDKFPLRYFFDEYGLKYRAAFTGCSSDTEPSAKTIAYLIDKVRTEHLPAVYYLELNSHLVAEIIGEETKAEPLLFHSCHNVTRKDFDSGVTYLELMEGNVQNLRKGLN